MHLPQGLTACTSCPMGVSTSSDGSVNVQDCNSCAAGFIPSNQGCLSCPVGKYWNVTCYTCPPGRFTEQNASTNCDVCPSGKWNPSTGMSSRNGCIACPNVGGAVCLEGSTVPFVKFGWHRTAESGQGEILQCFPEEACPESGTLNTTCSTAYTEKPVNSVHPTIFVWEIGAFCAVQVVDNNMCCCCILVHLLETHSC
jgi:hypothetical protein